MSSDETVAADSFPANARIVDCPALVGDVLLFSAYCPHRSVTNTAGVMRWAADIRFNVPEAGDYYPAEGGFLGCSSQPGADVVDDWREYVKRRTEHREAFVAEQQRQAKEQEEAQKQYVKAVVRRSGKTSMLSRLVALSVSPTWQASLFQGGVGSRRATRRLRAWSGTRSRGSWSGRAGCRRSSRGPSSEGDSVTSSL